MLKIHRLSIGLNIAVADVLKTRISTHARKGLKSQNYLNHDCSDKMKMISPKKTTQSLKTEPRIKREILLAIFSTKYMCGNGQS